MSLKNIRKTNYVYSLILMFLFAMVLAPATAYAHEGDVVIVTSSPTDSITVQPVTVQPAVKPYRRALYISGRQLYRRAY